MTDNQQIYTSEEVQQVSPPLDGCLVFLLYVVSFFFFIVGVIGGIVLLNNPNSRNQEIGKNMIIIALVVPVLACCISAFALLTPACIIGFGGY